MDRNSTGVSLNGFLFFFFPSVDQKAEYLTAFYQLLSNCKMFYNFTPEIRISLSVCRLRGAGSRKRKGGVAFSHKPVQTMANSMCKVGILLLSFVLLSIVTDVVADEKHTVNENKDITDAVPGTAVWI